MLRHDEDKRKNNGDVFRRECNDSSSIITDDFVNVLAVTREGSFLSLLSLSYKKYTVHATLDASIWKSIGKKTTTQ